MAPQQLQLRQCCQQRRERAAALVTAAGFGFGKAAEKKLSKQKACPCGSGAAFKECCQRYHEGALPETPEQLMRSRYSAYVKANWRYVEDTTHPLNPLLTDANAQAGNPTIRDDIIATCDKLGFEKLKVLSVEPGADENEGFVTFQAWFKNVQQLGQRAQGFNKQTFVERSRFLRQGGKWLYVDGEQDWKQ
ncbi:zinc chelation isoform B [Micractinium conductrix]|uniref:Zinc chelation isoform B n=1 Tax=Micractinium conductrix TaxID=554055 RepID=A0A2P6V421_9CHLO|nr:zinc chelation isoform B [Micractinium conductrix]|eukprot:PSC68836.1 zinc chelation isoform B [Micractinium conductrix]